MVGYWSFEEQRDYLFNEIAELRDQNQEFIFRIGKITNPEGLELDAYYGKIQDNIKRINNLLGAYAVIKKVIENEKVK